jgi:hypothetical protein
MSMSDRILASLDIGLRRERTRVVLLLPAPAWLQSQVKQDVS